MNATFGFINKRINSTKSAMGSSVVLDVKLKEPCSMRDPVFKVKGLTKAQCYNYCYWEFKSYWIDDIVYLTNDIQEVHCHLDPLATFKADILKNYALVLYGPSAQMGEGHDDPRMNPAHIDKVLTKRFDAEIEGGNLMPYFDPEGTYILRFMDCGNGGGVKTIALNNANFNQCLADLDSFLDGLSIDKIIAALGGSSWRDNIMSCIWVPFAYSKYQEIGEAGTTFRIGGINCEVEHVFLSHVVMDWGRHIFSGTPGEDEFSVLHLDFMKYSRWTSYQLSTPIGALSWTKDDVGDDQTLGMGVVSFLAGANFCTGDITLRLRDGVSGAGKIIGELSGNVAIDMLGFIGNGKGYGEQMLGSAMSGMKAGAHLGLAAASLGMSAGAMQVGMAAQSSIAGINNREAIALQGANNAFSKNQIQMQANMERAAQSAKIAESQYNTSIGQRILDSGISLANTLPTSTSGGSISGPASGGASSLWACMMPADFGHFHLNRTTFQPGVFWDTTYDDYCNEYGWPVNRWLKLEDLTGYVKCSGFSYNPSAVMINIQPSPADLATINSMFNAGVFIE